METTKTKLPIFKASEMAVGDTVTIVITSMREGNYGPTYRGEVNGVDSFINFAGNIKRFLPTDIETGSKALNVEYKLTRVADRPYVNRKGEAALASNFTLYPTAKGAKAAAAAPKTTTANVDTTSIADKLAAIRAKKNATGSTNG